ncbi:PLDc N-terminal domain-containing protein [Paenarthrobacter sp. OM7]|uniref:PLDc N-terminal domain-containing protein n=1 Tax=Paenarthrobacter sp. OM7 TaxID=3041264 RepID=UPI002469BE1E|nr:PLDc N-terminal domain-containing protein [Paenarthrobacter sp. OM7]WGM21712.1 PLDc N-terminal domain-containing protein [Paenarthrobacter sp. OM7]
MEAWEWVLASLAGLSAVFVMGANLWAIFDVLRQDGLDQAARIMWVMLFFVVPLFGVVVWLYAKTRLAGLSSGTRLRKTL